MNDGSLSFLPLTWVLKWLQRVKEHDTDMKMFGPLWEVCKQKPGCESPKP